LPAITDPLLSTSPTLETPRLTPQVNTSLSRPEVKLLPDVERERSTPETTTIEVAASSPTITLDEPAALPLDDDQLASPPPVDIPEIGPNAPPQTKILSTIPSAPPKQTATWSDRWNTLSAGTLRHSPQLLFMLWLAGVTWGVARWLFYWTRLRCLLAAATPADPELQAESQRVAAEYKLHPVPRLVVTQASCSPFVCGGLRPTVVLPASLLPHLEPGELRRILLHEQAHLKRRDLWWNWLPEICVVPLLVPSARLLGPPSNLFRNRTRLRSPRHPNRRPPPGRLRRHPRSHHHTPLGNKSRSPGPDRRHHSWSFLMSPMLHSQLTNISHGPWSTSIADHHPHTLSRFWKRRIAMLARAPLPTPPIITLPTPDLRLVCISRVRPADAQHCPGSDPPGTRR
jgi:hypothetical protein